MLCIIVAYIYISEKKILHAVCYEILILCEQQKRKKICVFILPRVQFKPQFFLFYFILTCVLFIIFLTWFLLYFQFNVSDRRQNTIKKLFLRIFVAVFFFFLISANNNDEIDFSLFLFSTQFTIKHKISFLHQHLLFLSIYFDACNDSLNAFAPSYRFYDNNFICHKCKHISIAVFSNSLFPKTNWF